MNSFRTLVVTGALGALAALAGPAQAASISFHLDESSADAWPDGVAYVEVTISDSDLHPGDIEFRVTLLPVLNDDAGGNFGIQAFGFNTTGAANAVTASNIIDPVGWIASVNDRLDGFGNFEIRTDTNGAHRQSPLQFRITGIASDTPADYAVAGAGGYFFAAHVAGLESGNGSAYFAGSRLATAIVPVPAAMWLLGSALGLLGLVRNRPTTPSVG